MSAVQPPRVTAFQGNIVDTKGLVDRFKKEQERGIVGEVEELGTVAIVNAANADLLSGGGICRAIFDAAGDSDLQDECWDDDKFPKKHDPFLKRKVRCPTGEAVITSAQGIGKPIKHIIHAVGPDWTRDPKSKTDPGTRNDYRKKLKEAYLDALRKADGVVDTVVFPALSASIYAKDSDPKVWAWRRREAVICALEALDQFYKKNDKSQLRVRFICADQKTVGAGKTPDDDIFVYLNHALSKGSLAEGIAALKNLDLLLPGSPNLGAAPAAMSPPPPAKKPGATAPGSSAKPPGKASVLGVPPGGPAKAAGATTSSAPPAVPPPIPGSPPDKEKTINLSLNLLMGFVKGTSDGHKQTPIGMKIEALIVKLQREGHVNIKFTEDLRKGTGKFKGQALIDRIQGNEKEAWDHLVSIVKQGQLLGKDTKEEIDSIESANEDAIRSIIKGDLVLLKAKAKKPASAAKPTVDASEPSAPAAAATPPRLVILNKDDLQKMKLKFKDIYLSEEVFLNLEGNADKIKLSLYYGYLEMLLHSVPDDIRVEIACNPEDMEKFWKGEITPNFFNSLMNSRESHLKSGFRTIKRAAEIANQLAGEFYNALKDGGDVEAINNKIVKFAEEFQKGKLPELPAKIVSSPEKPIATTPAKTKAGGAAPGSGAPPPTPPIPPGLSTTKSAPPPPPPPPKAKAKAAAKAAAGKPSSSAPLPPVPGALPTGAPPPPLDKSQELMYKGKVGLEKLRDKLQDYLSEHDDVDISVKRMIQYYSILSTLIPEKDHSVELYCSMDDYNKFMDGKLDDKFIEGFFKSLINSMKEHVKDADPVVSEAAKYAIELSVQLQDLIDKKDEAAQEEFWERMDALAEKFQSGELPPKSAKTAPEHEPVPATTVLSIDAEKLKDPLNKYLQSKTKGAGAPGVYDPEILFFYTYIETLGILNKNEKIDIASKDKKSVAEFETALKSPMTDEMYSDLADSFEDYLDSKVQTALSAWTSIITQKLIEASNAGKWEEVAIIEKNRDKIAAQFAEAAKKGIAVPHPTAADVASLLVKKRPHVLSHEPVRFDEIPEPNAPLSTVPSLATPTAKISLEQLGKELAKLNFESFKDLDEKLKKNIYYYYFLRQLIPEKANEIQIDCSQKDIKDLMDGKGVNETLIQSLREYRKNILNNDKDPIVATANIQARELVDNLFNAAKAGKTDFDVKAELFKAMGVVQAERAKVAPPAELPEPEAPPLGPAMPPALPTRLTDEQKENLKRPRTKPADEVLVPKAPVPRAPPPLPQRPVTTKKQTFAERFLDLKKDQVSDFSKKAERDKTIQALEDRIAFIEKYRKNFSMIISEFDFNQFKHHVGVMRAISEEAGDGASKDEQDKVAKFKDVLVERANELLKRYDRYINEFKEDLKSATNTFETYLPQKTTEQTAIKEGIKEIRAFIENKYKENKIDSYKGESQGPRVKSIRDDYEALISFYKGIENGLKEYERLKKLEADGKLQAEDKARMESFEANLKKFKEDAAMLSAGIHVFALGAPERGEYLKQRNIEEESSTLKEIVSKRDIPKIKSPSTLEEHEENIGLALNIIKKYSDPEMLKKAKGADYDLAKHYQHFEIIDVIDESGKSKVVRVPIGQGEPPPKDEFRVGWNSKERCSIATYNFKGDPKDYVSTPDAVLIEMVNSMRYQKKLELNYTDVDSAYKIYKQARLLGKAHEVIKLDPENIKEIQNNPKYKDEFAALVKTTPEEIKRIQAEAIDQGRKLELRDDLLTIPLISGKIAPVISGNRPP